MKTHDTKQYQKGFYELAITQTTDDNVVTDNCEIMIVDQNNNAPLVTLSTRKLCANLVPGKSMIPIVVDDKDDCSLGNCYPFTFELYEGIGSYLFLSSTQ